MHHLPLFTQFRKEILDLQLPSTIGHIDECHYVSTTAFHSNASISMCNELTNDTRSSRNKHFIMFICSFSVIKSCAYWDSSTLQALHEHACLFLIYEKCNVDRVGKMLSNKTVSSDFKSFCLWLWITSVLASTEDGGGVREINYIYAILCPTGPR